MADLLRISILGAMPSGEEWSINPCYRINLQDVDVTITQLNAMAVAIDALTVPTSLRALMNSATTIVGCRVEARTNEGVLDNLTEHTRTVPIPGTGSFPHPFQTSQVFSLRSPLAGASGRGRVYWPATGAQMLDTTLRIEPTLQSNSLTAMKTYLGDIRGAITAQVPDVILAVWSRKLNTTLGVTRLQAGDILDTQRRRRDTLVESYLSVAVP